VLFRSTQRGFSMLVPLYTQLSDLLHSKMIEIYEKGLILGDIDEWIKCSDNTPCHKVLFPNATLIRPSAVRTVQLHDYSILEVACCYNFRTSESSNSNTEGLFLELRKIELHYTGESYVFLTQFFTRYIKLLFQNSLKQSFYTQANKVIIL